MLRDGYSWSKIEKTCGVSRTTISRIRREILEIDSNDRVDAGNRSVLEDADLTVRAI